MATTEPISIPVISRPSTPRPRSDTICTASSTSSILQTPLTPPILGVLGQYVLSQPIDPSSPEVEIAPAEITDEVFEVDLDLDLDADDTRELEREVKKPRGLRARLDRSRSSFRDKKAKVKAIIALNRSRTSFDSGLTPLAGPYEGVTTEATDYFPPIPPPQPKPADLFGALPREIRLLVLRKLVEGWEGHGRWSGEVGGRRELIRLSRISRSWQALCFDGQLWPILDVTPMASMLPPRTFQRILDSSRKYTRRLCLRGMDDIDFVYCLPNLTHLDLRGCRRLSAEDICQIVRSAPGLLEVNLEGVQSVSAMVLRALAGCGALKKLDVSRCWEISIADMAVYLRSTTAELDELRVAGLRSYGPAGREFVCLAAVKVLDLGGCNLKDEDLACRDTTEHLILSSNPYLTVEVFTKLDLPNLTRLEIAHLDLFREVSNPLPLLHFLRRAPELRKIDLDSTGSSRGIDDRLVDTLIRHCPNLDELHINHAKLITPEAMIRLIRGCTRLMTLEADNTSATNAVMREFMRRRPAHARLNLMDCRAITPAWYSAVSWNTRPRAGWEGYDALPFGYEHTERDERMPVLKTFWSWRRVGVPPVWREARMQEPGDRVVQEAIPARPRGSRRGSWWRGDDEYDERGGCTVM